MMPRSGSQFREVRVYDGVAEPTGTMVDRKTVRGSNAVCRSMAELARKVRAHGDGLFYVAADAWPEGTDRYVLSTTWTTMS